VTNDLVGDPEGSSYDQTLAVELGRLAYSVPKPLGRRSRFWFKMDAPVVIDKEVSKPKKLDHIDSQIVSRLEDYLKASPGQYQENIDKVREFFLTEIAPLTLSVSGGTTQAAEVLRRMLDTDIDPSTAQRFVHMVNRASTLKMAQFVIQYFGLDPKHLDAVIGIAPQSGAGSVTDLKFVLDHVAATTKLMKNEITSLRRKLDDAKT
jgi:hypothetical protein